MARATCVEPSEHRILSTIVALLICVPAVTAAVPEQARAGGDPGRKCAATKMSAVGQDLAALMHCVTTAVRQGKPLDPECAQGAAARLEGRFVKAEEKGGCFAMAEGSLLAHRASELVAVIANGVPSAPPCPELGKQCGSCGTGFCVVRAPYDPLDPQFFCAKPLNPSSRHCDSDSQCGIGESCGFLGEPTLDRFCYTHCPGCEDSDPCTRDVFEQEACSHYPVAAHGVCSDGDHCNGAESCSNGVCVAGFPTNCDDANPCSADTCDPLTGCQHIAVPDGTPCGSGLSCSGGVCG